MPEVLTQDIIKRLIQSLPNESVDYPCWLLWILVAGIKMWKDSGISKAVLFYWNIDAIMNRPS